MKLLMGFQANPLPIKQGVRFFPVIADLRTSARRISFAIALSALIHAAILWLPDFRLTHQEIQLPPLTARLEALPKSVVNNNQKPVPINHLGKAETIQSGKPIVNAAETMKPMEKSKVKQPFPKHLQLGFAVYRGGNIFKVGDLRHQLDRDQDNYSLQSIRLISEVSGPGDSELLNQSSRGKIGEAGFEPEVFKQEIITRGRKKSLKATFDRTKQKLYFSNGEQTDLPADTQDILSFIYQLSQLSLRREIIPLSISEGTDIVPYQFEIGSEEEITTPLGKIRALHLRRMHTEGEPYFEIWLGTEYRLLPVKFRQIAGSDKVIEEFQITDMRASDE